MSPRGQRRPGDRFPRPRRKVTKTPKKSGACSFALPAAAARTVLVLAQLAAVSWRIRGAR